MMKIIFVARKERGLHCRFCKSTKASELFETKPISGIVCKRCKAHLEDYIKPKEASSDE